MWCVLPEDLELNNCVLMVLEECCGVGTRVYKVWLDGWKSPCQDTWLLLETYGLEGVIATDFKFRQHTLKSRGMEKSIPNSLAALNKPLLVDNAPAPSKFET